MARLVQLKSQGQVVIGKGETWREAISGFHASYHDAFNHCIPLPIIREIATGLELGQASQANEIVSTDPSSGDELTLKPNA